MKGNLPFLVFSGFCFASNIFKLRHPIGRHVQHQRIRMSDASLILVSYMLCSIPPRVLFITVIISRTYSDINNSLYLIEFKWIYLGIVGIYLL